MPDIEKKKCVTCGKEKPVSDFYKRYCSFADEMAKFSAKWHKTQA